MASTALAPAPHAPPPIPAAPAHHRQDSIRPLLPLVALIYLFLLFPIETRSSLFGVNLPIYRAGILVFLPLMLARSKERWTTFHAADWMILMAAGWIVMSFCGIYGLGPGFIRASGVVVDFAGAFLMGRLAIDSPRALRRLLVLICPGLALAGAEMMIESVSGRILVRPLFSRVFGAVAAYANGEIVGTLSYLGESRLGLTRAFGPFSHPILGGLVLMSALPLWLNSHIRGWPLWVGIFAALCGLFSISSAAILGLVLAALMVLTDRLKRYAPNISWPVISVMAIFPLLAADLGTGAGLVGLTTRLTLSSQTAYYRVLIWQYGTASVANHPWLGIGYADWVRPIWMLSPSIDAHFLFLAMRNGLPPVILLAAAILMVMIGVGRNSRVGGVDRDTLVGLNFALVILMVSAQTVTFFGEGNVWLMMMVGIASSLGARGAMAAGRHPPG